MRFELFSEVILTKDVPEEGLRAGDVGVVVEHHPSPAPGLEEGYSLEVFDMTGKTVAVPTVQASMVRYPTATDRPAVRALSA